MLKERDYASVVRLLDRTKAMRGADVSDTGVDPADDIEFCNEVLGLLGQLREVLNEEIGEGDPDATTAWAAEHVLEVEDMIGDCAELLSGLQGNTIRPEGYIPG